MRDVETGVVSEVDEDNRVWVKWKHSIGILRNYRMGLEGAYDLMLTDNEKVLKIGNVLHMLKFEIYILLSYFDMIIQLCDCTCSCSSAL